MPILTDKNWTIIGSGYHQLELPDWNAFVEFVCNDLLNYQSYIWRGQRCEDWKLEPTIDRLIRESIGADTIDQDFVSQHLNKFKLAARGRRGLNPAPIEEENDWWALGQHYGLATPLLDWTTSPFVAAFFAFHDIGNPQSDNRAIFALHQPTLEGWVTRKVEQESLRRRKLKEDIQQGRQMPGLLGNTFLDLPVSPDLVLVRPQSDENNRLVNQSGLFTRLRSKKPLEEWVTENHPMDDEYISLLKILIPNADRDICLRTLNRMNINPLSLFPDLTGVSRYCNLFSEVENY